MALAIVESVPADHVEASIAALAGFSRRHTLSETALRLQPLTVHPKIVYRKQLRWLAWQLTEEAILNHHAGGRVTVGTSTPRRHHHGI